MDLERERQLITRMGTQLPGEADLQDFCAHGEIVSAIAALVAKALGEDEAFCREIAVAGMLHDIGKLELADVIYGHRDDIMAVERSKYVRMHPALGIDVLRKEGAYSEEVISFIANHHENFDGTGYPNHLEGEEIPYGARILRVCDVFAALVSNRRYRSAFSIDTAIEMMIDDVKDYDMKVFLAFLSVVYSNEFAGVRDMINRAQANAALLSSQPGEPPHAGDRGLHA